MSDGVITIKVKADTKRFEKQIAEVEYELKQIDFEMSHAKELKLSQRSIDDYTKKAEILKNKLIDLRKKQDDLNKSNIFGNMKSSIEGVIKKITRWGLAIFGIRSAYMAVRQAASTLSEYNEQIKTDIAYIRYSLATALEPVVQRIINLVYELLSVINAISIALFNYNLFQNASINNFKKMNASASKLKKTLAGFDEMNIIQDTSGGGGGGNGTPSTNLSEKGKADGEKFKSYWQGIIDFWEKDWEDAFNNITGNWSTFIQGIGYIGKGIYDVFKGIIELVVGVWNGLVALFTGDFTLLQTAYETLINGFKDLFSGLVELITGLLLTLLGFILGIIRDIWDGIVSILSAIGKWVYDNVIKPVGDFFAGLWKAITNDVKIAFDVIKGILQGVVNWIKNNVITPITNFFKKMWDGIKNGVNSVKNAITTAFKAIGNAVKTPLNWIIDGINTLIKGLNKISFDIPDWIPIIGGQKWGFNLKTIPRLAKGGIINMPGKGVMSPYGQAIRGEAGAEGVMPLTDSQQMALLGEAIGKYITINATVVNQMNGRVISRELQKVQNDSDFAFNR